MIILLMIIIIIMIITMMIIMMPGRSTAGTFCTLRRNSPPSAGPQASRQEGVLQPSAKLLKLHFSGN